MAKNDFENENKNQFRVNIQLKTKSRICRKRRNKKKEREREQNVDGFILITIGVTISHWLMMIKIMDPNLPKKYRLFSCIPKKNNVLIVLFFGIRHREFYESPHLWNRLCFGISVVLAPISSKLSNWRARFGSRVWFENQFQLMQQKKIERKTVSHNLQKQKRKRIFQFCRALLVKWHVSCGLRRGIIILKTTFTQREGKQTTKITKFLNTGRKKHKLALNLFIR